jgi:hypothetical protein
MKNTHDEEGDTLPRHLKIKNTSDEAGRDPASSREKKNTCNKEGVTLPCRLKIKNTSHQ